MEVHSFQPVSDPKYNCGETARVSYLRGKSVWLNINGSGITAQLDTMMNPIRRGQLFFKLLMRKSNEELQAKTYERIPGACYQIRRFKLQMSVK
jgi:hypothetical protein